jgi:hypothetical protein
LGGFEVHEDADAVGEFVEGSDAEGQFHAGFGAELVDEELMAGMAFDVLEEQGGAAGLYRFVVPRSRKRGETWGTLFFVLHVHLAHTVCDFGDFEDGVDFGLDAFEFAGEVKGGDPLAEVVEGQRASPGN